jgi:hypothetical protein
MFAIQNRTVILLVLLASVAWEQPSPVRGESQTADQQSTEGTNARSHEMSTMTQDQSGDGSAAMGAMHSMEGRMDMGPHIKMTDLRPARTGVPERAQAVVDAARKVAAKYLDYRSALSDGFEIFHPEVPQKIYHFVNRDYAREAAVSFNPEHPTALLYEKHGDGYNLVGVMYTAPRTFSEDQLDQRIPLSIAQWHEHVNFCAPPPDRRSEILATNSQFGLKGSITTRQACDAVGGTFHPVVFNWMVHVYPFEKDQKSIWSVERQHADS